jgi:hypothetical protein
LIPYKRNTKALLDASKEVGLEVNPEKTKYIVTCVRFPWLNNISTVTTLLRFLSYATMLDGLGVVGE